MKRIILCSLLVATLPFGSALAEAPKDEAGQAPRGVRGGHERDGADDPVRELRSCRSPHGSHLARARRRAAEAGKGGSWERT